MAVAQKATGWNLPSVPESLLVGSPLADSLTLTDLRRLRLVCRRTAAAISGNRRWAAARSRRLDVRVFASEIFGPATPAKAAAAEDRSTEQKGGAAPPRQLVRRWTRTPERALEGALIQAVQVQGAEERVFVAALTPSGSSALVCVPFGCGAWGRGGGSDDGDSSRPVPSRLDPGTLRADGAWFVSTAPVIWSFRVRGDVAALAVQREGRTSLALFGVGDSRRSTEMASVPLPLGRQSAYVCFLDDERVAVAAGGLLLVFCIKEHNEKWELTVERQVTAEHNDSLRCVAGIGSVVATTQSDRLLIFDLSRPPGAERIVDYYPQTDALREGVSHDNIGSNHIRDLFVDSDWVLLNAAQHSGFFLAMNWRTGERVWHEGFATRGACMTSHMVATTMHYGECVLWDPLRKDEGNSGREVAPGFKVPFGPSCIHFDHSAMVVGRGSQTMLGTGSGVYLWRLEGPVDCDCDD